MGGPGKDTLNNLLQVKGTGFDLRSGFESLLCLILAVTMDQLLNQLYLGIILKNRDNNADKVHISQLYYTY